MDASSFVRETPTDASSPALAESLSVAGYKLLHALGVGGGGAVYKAIQRSTGQSVAIKVLSVDRIEAGLQQRRVERFQREIAVCSGLYHPDIVRLLDSGRLEHQQYFAVFEYIPGTTLAELLRQEGALRVQRARALMLQLLAPLAHAHDKGIAHRDLKPANIMVTPDGGRDRLKVLDLGISIASKTIGPTLPRLTLSHEWVGTPTYTAPEQLRGEGDGIKADLYAWGLIFVECLTGAALVRGRSLAEIVESQLGPTAHALPATLAQHRLGKLLARVLDKDPARRPADASLIQSLLERTSVADLEGPRGYLRDQPSGSVARPPAFTDTLLDERREPQVEQRYATALCCRVSLVGSSPNAEELDALLEDAAELVAEVVRQFGAGTVFSLGMYSLAYFGLAHAREEDVRMALRASLELASRHETMQRWLDGMGVRLTLRIGIHCGPVTARVEAPGQQPIHGVTARTAMQLAERADAAGDGPARILVTDAFHGFASRHGELEPYTAGDSTTAALYRLIGESHALDRGAERLPLFGRAEELDQLLGAHRTASTQGVGVLLVGEAGIGKSRLARELMDKLVPEGVSWMQARCLPEWQNAFLRPLSELLKRRFGISGEKNPQEASEKLVRALRELGLPESEAVPLFCTCFALPLPQRHTASTWSPQKQRERLHQYLVEALLGYMRQGAALLIEDIHWGDPSSLECLDMLLREAQGSAAFVVMTARPGGAQVWSEALRVITLGRLQEGAIKALAERLLPDRSQTGAMLDEIVERSDGVPLFAEELSLALRASAPPQSTQHSGTSAVLPHASVPLSLRALLTSRLDEAPHAKPTAQFAAALGREFSLELLAAALQQDEYGPLAELEQLVSSGVLIKRRRVDGPVYAFRHALIRDNAYDSMSLEQRQQTHRRIALGLELQSPATCLEQPDVFAQHWEYAGDVNKAVHYWQAAAHRSRTASAHLEALAQLERARRLLDTLEPTAALEQRRAELLLARGITLVAKRGYTDPEAKEAFECVAARFPATSPSIQLAFEARFGLWHFYSKRVDAQRALETAEELSAIAGRSGEAAFQTSAHAALCFTHFGLGNLALAIQASRQCRASYEFERHRHLATLRGDDPLLSALSFEALAELLRGSPEVAAARVGQALEHAERLNYPALNAGVSCQAASLYLIWGSAGALFPDVERVHEHARRAHSIASEHGFPFWELIARLLEALARVASGEEDAVSDLLLGVQRRRETGATLGECWQSCFISLAQRSQGKHAEAIATLEAALAYCEHDDARSFEPEVHRHLAETLLDPANPERDVQRGSLELDRADAVALKYGTGWWSLAIAMSRVRLGTSPDMRRLEALLETMPAGPSAPPLVREAHALLEERRRAERPLDPPSTSEAGAPA